MSTLPCPCGGTLRVARSEGIDHDLTWLIGIPIVVRGQLMLNRCDQCGEVTLPGRIIEKVTDQALVVILGLDRRLSGAEARFLRKSGVGMATDQLAEQLGLSASAVSDWERSVSLGAAADAALRDLVVGVLTARSRFDRRFDRDQLRRLTRRIRDPRTRRAPARPQPLLISYPAAA